jgi:aryl-alcohol dehydrogenase-like predicted oxidoreductase
MPGPGWPVTAAMASGLKVSRIALGCMSFGDTSRGFSEWSLGEEDSQPFFRQAVELGITFWDTANVYGLDSSEEIVGRAIRTFSRREDVVLATPRPEGTLSISRTPRATN